MRCTCSGRLNLVKEHKIFKGRYAILSEFYRCSVCGEELFNDKQTEYVAKEIDRLDEKLKYKSAFSVKAPSFLVYPV